MTRGRPLGEGIRPPRRICAATTGRQPPGRRRHIAPMITAGPEALGRIAEAQLPSRWMIAGLASTDRKGLSLTNLMGRGMTFRPLRLKAHSAADIVSRQRVFLNFQYERF